MSRGLSGTNVLESIEQVPPHNREAEMAVLGSMLVDKDAQFKALDLLREEDFYKEAHKKIFYAIASLRDKHVEADAITVGEFLKQDGSVADVGGQIYLFELTNLVPVALHVEHYAGIVREKALLRGIGTVAREVLHKSNSEQVSAETLLDSAQASFLSLSQMKASTGLVSMSELMHNAVEILEDLAETGKYITGTSTGFAELDKYTAGLQPANLVIVAGRPSMGKTSFCMNIAEHVVVKEKRPVLFFSLEMSNHEMALRLLCSYAKLNLKKARSGYITRKHWPVLTNAASILAEAPLYFDFTSSPSIMEIRASSRRWAHELKYKDKSLALIIVDYLQLMRGSGGRENRQQEIAEISRGLKALSRELDVPVIALSQLNRRPEERGRDGRPQLSDLRESGALEQDADVVLAIYREEVYKRDDPDLKGKAKIYILKQRNGPTGEFDMNFMEEYTRFQNLEKVTESPPE